MQLLDRFEPEKGLFIAESPKVIERALNAGCQPVSMLVEDRHVEGEARDTIADCDYMVRIPMSHGVDSLNVAAAGAVTFWQLGGNEEKREKSGPQKGRSTSLFYQRSTSPVNGFSIC